MRRISEVTCSIGKAKILKSFTRTKERQIVGGKVVEGQIALDSVVKIMRRDFEIGKGKIVNTSNGAAGKGDANGKLDWVEVDFGKPFLSGGKLQTVRRIPNIYTKTYFDYPLE